ncbi:MAG: hypothetical protein QXS17_03455 [Candidatus Micrarchaeaceae archaeon]
MPFKHGPCVLFSFALALLLLGAVQAQGPVLNSTGMSKASANYTIAKAEAFVQKINESTYLIFSPNLTTAYKYLSEAKKSLNSSPYMAGLYANEAISSSQTAYEKLNAYRYASAAVMLAITIAIGAILVHIMKKPRSTHAHAHA